MVRRITIRCPASIGKVDRTNWPEWYSGPAINATPLVSMPSPCATPAAVSNTSLIGPPAALMPAPMTPLGAPVVPDV